MATVSTIKAELCSETACGILRRPGGGFTYNRDVARQDPSSRSVIHSAMFLKSCYEL